MNRKPHDVMHRIVVYTVEVEAAIDSAVRSVGLQALKPTQREAIRTQCLCSSTPATRSRSVSSCCSSFSTAYSAAVAL